MKKIFIGVVCLLMIGLLMTACQKEIILDIEEVGKALASQGTFEDEITLVSDDIFEMNYLAKAPNNVVDAVLYMSSGATAEEIAVIECADEGTAKKVKNVVDDRVQYLTESFRDYVPDELTKLEDPVLLQTGKYVILCISADDAKAEEIVNSFIR